jgi:hypothetical protein
VYHFALISYTWVLRNTVQNFRLLVVTINTSCPIANTEAAFWAHIVTFCLSEPAELTGRDSSLSRSKVCGGQASSFVGSQLLPPGGAIVASVANKADISMFHLQPRDGFWRNTGTLIVPKLPRSQLSPVKTSEK